MTDERPETKVLDGGLGTELAADETLVFKDHPLWTASLLKDNPKAIKAAHSRFLCAGSEAVITASYQASVDGFMKYFNVSAEDAQLLLQSSVDIAKDAVKEFSSANKSNKDLYVAASVGPYGATLHDMSEYDGHYVETMTAEQLKNWHRDRMAVLLSRDPDYLAIETMPALKEVLAILGALREFPNAKAWVTFTCKDAKTTFHGDNFVESVKTVSLNPQVESIGVNCCEVTFVEELLRSVKDVLQPHQNLIAYPNNWQKFVDKRWVCDISRNFSGYVEKWLSVGAMGWIGGCCGVTSPQVGEMTQIVKNWNADLDNLKNQMHNH